LELLNQRWSAVYTSPQATHLSVAFGEATAIWTPTSSLSFNGVGYYRQFWQAHTDGNGTDGQPCDPSGALFGQLCIGDGNTPINQNFAVLDTLSPGAFLGEIDRNWTSTASYGGTIQATNTNQIFRHDNHVVFGIDHGRSQFNGNSELGTIDQNLFVTGQGVFVDQPAADLTPVSLSALNTYTGIYLTDTFDLTSQLSVTGGRSLQ
jgi:iron complex outermembrane receptor protein